MRRSNAKQALQIIRPPSADSQLRTAAAILCTAVATTAAAGFYANAHTAARQYAIQIGGCYALWALVERLMRERKSDRVNTTVVARKPNIGSHVRFTIPLRNTSAAGKQWR